MYTVYRRKEEEEDTEEEKEKKRKRGINKYISRGRVKWAHV